MKRCNTCGMAKPATAFTKQKQRSGNFTLMFECKECATIKQTKRYQSYTPEQKLHKKNKFMIRKYGITIEDYTRMFNEQKECCKVCGIHQTELPKALVVDHCHATKKVRGLLCSGCNLAIGNIKENHTRAELLSLYIRSWTCA